MKDIKDLETALTAKKILVLGDGMVDESVFIERVGPSSEAAIGVHKKSRTSLSLGGALNVAANLVALGQEVGLYAVFGNDLMKDWALNSLEDLGVDVFFSAIDKERKTTVKTRFFGEGHLQLFRVDDEDTFEISKEIEDLVFEKIRSRIDEFDGIVFSDYLKGALTYSLVERVTSLARERGIKTLADPKSPDYKKYKNCDVLKPNEKEFSEMSGPFGKKATLDEIEREGLRIIRENGNGALVVTLGKEGMVLIRENGEFLHIEGEKALSVDVCGAGDTAVSVLASGISSNLSLEDSVRIANLASSKKVEKKGVSPVSKSDLFTEKGKVLKIEDLKTLRKKFKNKKIVFTNGCFDILHAGHLKSLNEAGKLGDILVVGINTDLSIKRQKGVNRPIIDLKNRVALLEGLTVVDYIVPFEDLTPKSVVEALKPDVLVKGSDYKDKEVVGREVVERRGGKVVLVELEDGLSTSLIIKRIKEDE